MSVDKQEVALVAVEDLTGGFCKMKRVSRALLLSELVSPDSNI